MENSMAFLRRCASFAALMAVSGGAYAQVSSINSAFVNTRAFNDIPSATFSGVTNYPTSISFSESGVSAASGFANRDQWQFSNNGGSSGYLFQNGDYFHVSLDLTLTGSPITPRKEAGFLFNTVNHGDLQFIVNTDGHEIVQFGGIGFFSFTAGPTPLLPAYNSGTKVTLGMTYFLDGNGRNALIFTANGVDSPVQEFGVGDGIGNGSTLGGYFQIVNDSANPSNAGSALFENISITAVPEPSVFALLGLGIISLCLRRRQA
jgi:hypothetical protein